jgi:hypothetical protein
MESSEMNLHKWYKNFRAKKTKEPEVKWVSVKEELPNSNRKVRLGVINGTVTYADTGYYENGEWFNTSSGAFGSSSLYAVIQWRELIPSDREYEEDDQ